MCYNCFFKLLFLCQINHAKTLIKYHNKFISFSQVYLDKTLIIEGKPNRKSIVEQDQCQRFDGKCKEGHWSERFFKILCFGFHRGLQFDQLNMGSGFQLSYFLLSCSHCLSSGVVGENKWSYVIIHSWYGLWKCAISLKKKDNYIFFRQVNTKLII